MNVHRLLLLGGGSGANAGSIDAMHALLARQVRRHFGSWEAVPAEWQGFLRDVDEAYREMEADRGILERSLEISSEEQTQANAELRALFHAFPDLFFRVDADGRILDYKVGSGSDALLPGQDMIGRDIRRVQQPGAARKLSEAMARVRASRSLVAVEYSLEISGRTEDYEARLGPLSRGEMFVIVRNITERKRVEKALWIKDWAIESSLSAIALTDMDGAISYANASFLRMWGRGRVEEVLGCPIAEFAAVPAQVLAILAQLKAGRAWSGEMSARRKDGGLFLAQLNTALIRNVPGAPVGIIFSALDITDHKATEEALRVSVERFAFAMEAANDGLWDWHVPTARPYLSPRYMTMLGYEPDELPAAHETWLGLLHPDDRDRAVRAFDDYLKGRSAKYETEFRLRQRSGEYLWILSRGKVVERDAHGHPVRVVGTHSDITARKLAEERVLRARDELDARVRERTRQLSEAIDSLRENEEWVRSILNNVPTGIVVIDPLTREVLDANPLALSLLKLRRQEVVGRNCQESICRTDQGVCPLCESGRPGNDTPQLVRADGSRIPVQRTVTPVVLGGRRVMLETLVDITERRRAEAELREARSAAEAGSEAKSRFLAMMSHEIRTPLNGVIGVLHLLRRDAATGPEQQRLMHMAAISADTLLRVINDILDFSKIEAGKLDLHPRPLDLRQTVAETASVFAQKAREKGLEWSVRVAPSVPRAVLGDVGRVAQVLGNLLGNAVKFTEAGGIILEVEMSGPVRFSISDTGIGIPHEQQAHLFQPFHQVDNSARRRFEGTGLGLGICQQLVLLMKGSMGFQSEPGRGSTFWFEVPFQVLPDESIAAPAADAGRDTAADETALGRAPNRRGLVLLVEDNEINQELARAMIEAAGGACECSTDGRSAVHAALSGTYDLILMDCMMPEMDGYEATRAIRAEELRRCAGGRTARVPIVALTANAMKGDRERCLAAGMDDYLSKPIDPAELVRMLAKWMPGQMASGPLSSAVPPDPAPIDHPELLRRCMGRRELAARLVAKLVGQAARDIEAAVHAVQRNDATALMIAAHRLKGAAANVAAGGLQRVAADLEILGRAGSLAGAAPLLEILQAEFARLQSAAATWRGNPVESKARTT
jgi:PAS domain S-box-containing protein